jgi:hypothetical protein
MRLTESAAGRSVGLVVPDGTFWEVHDGGGSTQDNTVAPSGDTSMDVFLSLENTTSGNFWTHQWFVDGVEFLDTASGYFSGADVGTLEFTTLDIGALLAAHDVGEIYYIDSVVVKDTSGTIIFQDDFEGGDLSAWDSVSGDATVVDFTPGGGGGTSTPGGDDCAAAADLGVGVSGTIIDDNVDWAGTWPTGADPLWNFFAGENGGGAPRWWKWTNPFTAPMLFQLNKVSGLAINAAVMVGACGSLTIPDISGVTTNTLQAEGDFFAADTLSVVVGAGETVFVEVDGYYDNPSPSEPPTGHRAFFTLEWSVVTVSFYDGIGLPTSDLLASGIATVDADVNPPITVLDGIRCGSAYYFLWKQERDAPGGPELWGGKINADGTGLATAKILDYAGTVQQFYSHLDSVSEIVDLIAEGGAGPMLASDGTDVWAGFFTYDQQSGRNWGDASWTQQTNCPGSPFAEENLSRTQDENYVYRGAFYQWAGSSWDLFQVLNQDILASNGEVAVAAAEAKKEGAVGPGLKGPESSSKQVDVDTFTWAMCASAQDPGHLWVYAAFSGSRNEVGNFRNKHPFCDQITDHPTAGTISNVHDCVCDGDKLCCVEAHWVRREVFEIVEHWRLRGGGGTQATTVLTSDGTRPAVGDTITVPDAIPTPFGFIYRTRTYTFVDTFTFPPKGYEVKRGANAAASLQNLRDAIDLGTGSLTPGVSVGTYSNQVFRAINLTSTTLEFVVKEIGVDGNLPISVSSAHLSFPAATFTGGTNSGAPVGIRIREQDIPIEFVSNYHPSINPIFDTAEHRFEVSNWTGGWNDGAQPAASVIPRNIWLVNDVDGLTPKLEDPEPVLTAGHPIVCVQPRDTFQNGVTTLKDTVEFWDYTGKVLRSDPASAYAPGTAPATTPGPFAIYVSDRFLNRISGVDERFVSLGRSYVARIAADCRSAPIPIDPASVPFSDENTFGRSWFSDAPRNYWAIPQDAEGIEAYDMLCSHAWNTVWHEDVEGLAPGSFARRFGLQRGYWDSAEPPFVILLNDLGEVRKYTVDRDYFICAVGVTPLVTDLYARVVF